MRREGGREGGEEIVRERVDAGNIRAPDLPRTASSPEVWETRSLLLEPTRVTIVGGQETGLRKGCNYQGVLTPLGGDYRCLKYKSP